MKGRVLNGRLYLDCLRRLSLPGLSQIAVFAFLTLLYHLFDSSRFQTLEELSPFLYLYQYVSPAFLGLCAFSFLFRRNASDFFHSLPYSRHCLFLGCSLAAASYVLAGILFCLGLSGLLLLLKGVAFMPSQLPVLAFQYGAGALLVLGCTLVGISLTGLRSTALLLGFVLLLAPRALAALYAWLLEDAFPLLEPASLSFFLSAAPNLPAALLLDILRWFLGYGGSSPAQLLSQPLYGLYTLFLALIAYAGALFAFRWRPSETAGVAAPNRPLRGLLRCLPSLPFFVLAGVFTAQLALNSLSSTGFASAGGLFLLLSLGLVAYVCTGLMLDRSLRGLPRTLAVLPLAFLLSFGLGAGALLQGNAWKQADFSPQRLQGVRFLSSEGVSKTYADLFRNELWYQEPELLSLVSGAIDRQRQSPNQGAYSQEVELTLQGGRRLRLQLLLSEEERQSLDALLMENEAYLSAGQQLPLQEEILSLRCDELEQGRAAELWQTLRQELSDLPAAAPTQAQNLSLYSTAQAGSERALGPFLLYRQSSLRPLGRLSLEGYRGLDFFSSSYVLSVQTPRSSQQYLELCLAENQTDLLSLRQALSEGLTPSVCFLNLSLTNVPLEDGLYASETYSSISIYQRPEEVDLALPQLNELCEMILQQAEAPISLDGCLATVQLSLEYEDRSVQLLSLPLAMDPEALDRLVALLPSA